MIHILQRSSGRLQGARKNHVFKVKKFSYLQSERKLGSKIKIKNKKIVKKHFQINLYILDYISSVRYFK